MFKKSNYNYLSAYYRKNYPVYLVHFITARCPFRCPTCFYWQETKRARTDDELSAGEIERMAQNHQYLWHVSITGGEPFVRPDVARIVTAYFQTGRAWHVSIHTTGCFPARTVAAIASIYDQLPTANLSVHFSLDLPPTEQAVFRGHPRAYDQFLQTYQALKNIQKSYPTLSIAIDTVFSGLNQDRLAIIYDHIATKLQPDDMSLIFVRGNPADPALKTVLLDTYEYWAERWYVRTSGHRFMSSFAAALKRAVSQQMRPILTRGEMTPPCQAGAKIAVIDEHGQILPCEMLSAFVPDTSVMGNIRDANYKLMTAIQSNSGDALRRRIRERRCACTYECALLTNIVTSPGAMVRALSNWPK